MPQNKYKRLRAKGVTFVFKYESDRPDLLHIYVRHLKEPDDAIFIFFSGKTTWLKSQEVWETLYENEGIWWFWIDEESKVVMIVSCFDKYSG